MSFQNYWLFVPACFAINMAFGPNNVLSLSNGASDGMRYSILAAFGRLLAFAVMIAISGFGLGALLIASETLFTILKFAGAAYLVWLGIKLFRSAPIELSGSTSNANNAKTRLELPADKLRRLAKQEFLVAAGNPKAILVFTAFFPQFVDRSAYTTSFIVLGATFLLFELIAIAIYAAIGTRLGTLTNAGGRFRWFNRASGSLMIGFGLLLAFLRRPAS
ncbi:Threonine/homoserine/homoserine lactone efflux protein [Collimonas sp. OK607]|uniref:LysE family translocator n=1 Tax=Collimonas sp. OK607 TaxID=1798194 RepID=UPI0008F394B9|nr:LysE family translocator [Collimonas sp. OK607]SFB04242.1 Threonine/homoserine/homoserine lactone efflux protein [Collimonas sp. OK607]